MARHGTQVTDSAGGSAVRSGLDLVVDGVTIDASRLDDLVGERVTQLGRSRSLVVLEGGNDLDFIVTYLAARAGRHPVLLAGAGSASPFVDRYDPDIVVSTGRTGAEIVRRRRVSAHALHPELALLMSTSGSTGSPKLVRLSASNLDANARAIAEFQRLTAVDCGVTSLPLHYCYGLSVLNAHRAAGASMVVTDLSVVDPCFWDAMRAHRVTNLAGVPHTFDLIARVGNERLRLDHLRMVTQAGGRMDPDRVRALAELGQRYGWDFVVMYGQTEATARIAYLPPDLARDHPDRVGVAIPGGTITIVPVGDPALPSGTGEVVYRGPNVMMGYAESPTDLRRGAELTELPTGDIGRIDSEGLLELVGRRSRIAKLFGLRIDLCQLEAQLAEHDLVAACASDDARLVVAVEGGGRRPGLAELVASSTALPARSIDVVEVDQLPRLANGKLDTAALLMLTPRSVTSGQVSAPPAADSVASIYRELLGVRSLAPSDTFAALGGDSFSYVEASIRLEALLGDLPDDWHVTSVAALSSIERGARRRWTARIETSVALRAFAIVAVVTTHMRVARMPAGAHILLAVAGFNYARFVVPRLVDARIAGATADVLRRGLTPIGRLAAVTSAWIAVQMIVWGGYGWQSLLLVNNYLGPPEHVEGRWRFWFFESVIVIMLAALALLSAGRVRDFARRHPFWLPMLLLAPAAVLRFELVRLVDRDYNYVYKPDTIVWCFLLGWAAAVARSWQQRVAVSLAAVALIPGYFDYLDRELRLTLAILALLWLPALIVPRPLARPAGWLASASMWIFMTHWVFWPELVEWMPRTVALVATIGAGAALWGGWRWIAGWWRAASPLVRSAESFRKAEQFRMVEHRPL